MAAPEYLTNQHRDMRAGNVIDSNIFHARLRKPVFQNICRIFRVAVIAPCIDQPAALKIQLIFKQVPVQRPKAAEGIRRKQNSFRFYAIITSGQCTIVKKKAQSVTARRQSIAVLLSQCLFPPAAGRRTDGSGQISFSFPTSFIFGKMQHQCLDIGTAAWFYMVYHQVIQPAAP